MTEHPAKGCTKAQIRAFEHIAINKDWGWGEKTTKALLAKGLIVQNGEREICRDRFGVVKIPNYEVPIALHIQWCNWCSEQPQVEEGSPSP